MLTNLELIIFVLYNRTPRSGWSSLNNGWKTKKIYKKQLGAFQFSEENDLN